MPGTGVYGADNADAWDRFGLDPYRRTLRVNSGICPGFTPRLVEDHGTWIEHLGEDGIVRREYKDKSALPYFVRGPVQSRDDWEELKANRLQPTLEHRLPGEWEQLRRRYADRDYVLALAFNGLWDFPRDLLGVEKLLLAFYDEPEMLRDMIEYLVDFYLQLFEPVLCEVEVDLVREAFPQLGIFGGLDKKALISGDRYQIDRELDSKVLFMLDHGG